jgi:zeta-carotene desaturase
MGNVEIRTRCAAESIEPAGVRAAGELHRADAYVVALPFERLGPLGMPAPAFEHSPITGIHLWFDRPVTDLPHATLLDRTIQWMFNKSGGSYLQLVVSASRDLLDMTRNEVISMALCELREYFPRAVGAELLKAHVVKEVRATFSAAPETESLRPTAVTGRPDLFLAGDWTRSGWPATMEGAVRSGYLAAEAVTRAAGREMRFVLPDIA